MNAFLIVILFSVAQPDFEYYEEPAPVGRKDKYKNLHVEAMMIITSGRNTMPKASFESLIQNRPEMRFAMAEKAIEMELMDERESKYLFAKDDEFYVDSTTVIRRFLELENTPKLGEATWRLPQREAANNMVQFNRAFHKTLSQRMLLETDRADGFRQVQKENEELYLIWDAVRDVQCEFYYVNVRRLALKKLICKIGWEDFYEGKLPPCAPIWYFVEE